MKILVVGVDLFPADRQTDRQTVVIKVIVIFFSFAREPKNGKLQKNHFNIVKLIYKFNAFYVFIILIQ